MMIVFCMVIALVRLNPDTTNELVRLKPDTTTAAASMRGVRLQPDRGDADRGRQTYTKVGCYQCHGREAQGASTGPRLGPNPIPLAQFTRYVRAPRAEMPPYTEKVLSNAELADIHAFVSSRPRPAR